MIIDLCYVEDYLKSIGWNSWDITPRVENVSALSDLENGLYVGRVDPQGVVLPNNRVVGLDNPAWSVVDGSGNFGQVRNKKEFPDPLGGFNARLARYQNAESDKQKLEFQTNKVIWEAGKFTASCYVSKGDYLAVSFDYTHNDSVSVTLKMDNKGYPYVSDCGYVLDAGLYWHFVFHLEAIESLYYKGFDIWYPAELTPRNDVFAIPALYNGWINTLNENEKSFTRFEVFSSPVGNSGQFFGFECLRYS